MFTIWHTGDIHYRNPESEAEWQEQREVTDALIASAAFAAPDLIVLAGDYQHEHRLKLDPRRRNEVVRLHVGLSSVAPVLSLRGNHDLWSDLLHLSQMDRVDHVQERFATIFQTDNGPLHCLAIPYAGYGWSVCDLRDVPPAQRREKQEDALRQMVADWRASLPVGATSIIAYHGTIRGSVVRLSQPLRTAAEPELSIEDLGCDMVAYAGSPTPQRFGDPCQDGMGPLVWRIPKGRSAALCSHIHTPQTWHCTPDHGIAATHDSIAHTYRKRLTYALRWDAETMALTWDDGAPWLGLPRTGPDSGITQRAYLDRARVRVMLAFPSTARAAIDKEAIRAAFRAQGAHEVRFQDQVSAGASSPVAVLETATHGVPATLFEEIEALVRVTGEQVTDEETAWMREACATLQMEG